MKLKTWKIKKKQWMQMEMTLFLIKENFISEKRDPILAWIRGHFMSEIYRTKPPKICFKNFFWILVLISKEISE